MSPAAGGADQRESGDLTELLQTLWRGRLWILGSAIALALVATILALLMTPIYRSSTVLIPVESERSSLSGTLSSALGSLGGLAALADFGFGSTGAATKEALAVLRSRQFTDEFIADRQLMPVLFSDKWDPELKRWKVPQDKQPTAFRAFKYFDRKVRYVVEDSNTGLITLQIDWKDPRLAADWANDLIERLNAEMRRREMVQIDDSMGFLEKELERTSILETRLAINRLMEAQINRRMLASVTEQFVFRVVDRAVPADLDQMLRPKKMLMILIGGCLGALIGGVLVLFARGRFALPQAGG